MKINWEEEKENLKIYLQQGYTYSQIANIYNLSCTKPIKKAVIKLELEEFYNPIFKCKFCGQEFTNKHQYSGHVGCCEKNPNYNKRISQLEYARTCIDYNKSNFNNISDDFICQFCGKHISNKGSLIAHEKTCKLNPNKIDDWRKYNLLSYFQIGHKGNNKFIKAEKLGLEKPIVSQETRELIGKIAKEKQLIYWSDEENRKIRSNIMREVAKKYPESYSGHSINGRNKHIIYKNISLDSTWEYEVAKALDENNINWIRPKYGFKYEWIDGYHTYYPDFYLIDLDLYIEVKGYEIEKDKAKYTAINNLIVLKEAEIKLIKEDYNNILKYILI